MGLYGLSVSSLLDRFLRHQYDAGQLGAAQVFQYPRCWIVSSDTTVRPSPRKTRIFQYPRCWIVSSDYFAAEQQHDVLHFQYPRCWIVSSDDYVFNVSSRGIDSFSILAVGSFPQTQEKDAILVRTSNFQYPRCWIVSSDEAPNLEEPIQRELSVSSLLDRFLRLVKHLDITSVFNAFSILAVGSFPQTSRVSRASCTGSSFSILAVGSFPQTLTVLQGWHITL